MVFLLGPTHLLLRGGADSEGIPLALVDVHVVEKLVVHSTIADKKNRVGYMSSSTARQGNALTCGSGRALQQLTSLAWLSRLKIHIASGAAAAPNLRSLNFSRGSAPTWAATSSSSSFGALRAFLFFHFHLPLPPSSLGFSYSHPPLFVSVWLRLATPLLPAAAAAAASFPLLPPD